MSLSIELCHQLYKAGFPQEPCERFWIAVDRGTALGNVYDRTHQPVACECPNSDELIEQIAIKHGFTCWTDIIEALETAWREGRLPHWENDLCDSLARFYLLPEEQV